MKIVFITDGGLEMGMGHIQRALTVAEEMRAGAEIRFLTKSDDTVVNQVKNAGFSVLKLKNDQDIIKLLKDINPHIVIIDKLDVEESFAKELKGSLNTKLVLFDNLSAANRYADVVVNAVMGSEYNNRKFVDKNTLYFYGLKYEVLRKEFYEFKKKGRILANKIERILLIFGGSDPSNLTSAVLAELLSLNSNFKIDVVLGVHFGYFDTLNRVMARYPGKKENVSIYKNIRNVAELMYKADLVIASPGLSVFESLCIGTPVIAIHQSLFQKNGFKGFLPTLDKNEVNRLGDLINNADFADPHGEYIRALDIGEGKAEVIDAIIGAS